MKFTVDGEKDDESGIMTGSMTDIMDYSLDNWIQTSIPSSSSVT